jgi:hypothetical protein
MTTDMGGPGFTGYGYSQGGSDSKTNDHIPQPQAEAALSPAADAKPAALAANDDISSGNGRDAEHAELGEVLTLDFDDAGPVPGFEASARTA